MTTSNATEPAPGKAKVKIEPGNPHAGNGGVLPPKEHQYGQPGANPRHDGCWKKSDTPRYKMEQMLKMPRNKLIEIANDTSAPGFERDIAEAIVEKKDLRAIATIINQVYGTPGTGAPEGTIQRPRPEDMVE